MRIASLSLAAMFGAAALMGTVAMAPTSDTKPALLVQDAKKAVTITGRAIGVDGQPAEKIPVWALIAKPVGAAGGGGAGTGGAGDPDRLSMLQDGGGRGEMKGRYTVAGKAVTDADGRFTIKNVREQGYLQVDVGDRFKTEWAIVYNVHVDGSKEAYDVGEVQLKPRLDAGDQGDQGGQGGGRGGRGGRGG